MSTVTVMLPFLVMLSAELQVGVFECRIAQSISKRIKWLTFKYMYVRPWLCHSRMRGSWSNDLRPVVQASGWIVITNENICDGSSLFLGSVCDMHDRWHIGLTPTYGVGKTSDVSTTIVFGLTAKTSFTRSSAGRSRDCLSRPSLPSPHSKHSFVDPSRLKASPIFLVPHIGSFPMTTIT